MITHAGVEFTDFTGRAVSKATQRIQWDPVMAEKAGYKHFMLKEIFEQPWALQETVLGRVSEERARVFLGELEIPEAALREVEQVVLVACGTSWHAALVGKFLLEQLARVRVEVDYGSEFRYRDPIVGDRTLAVVITQSGRNRRHPGRAARGARKGRPQHRRLQRRRQHGHARVRRHGLHPRGSGDRGRVHQGIHVAVARPAPARAAPRARPRDPGGAGGSGRSSRRSRTCPCSSSTPSSPIRAHPVDREALLPEHELPLSRDGASTIPSRSRGALKLKEVSYIHAEGYPAGEMKHGPIALIDEHMPVVALVPQDKVFEKMRGNLQEDEGARRLRDRGHRRARRTSSTWSSIANATRSFPSRRPTRC